jgi:DNA-directed RNA polymerase specialized sigma24 family protein
MEATRMRTVNVPPDQALAVARLKQWATLRMATRHGKTTNYARSGWAQRNAASFDARQVKVIDFERALSQLSNEEQIALVHCYRDHEGYPEIAAAANCSVRKLSYLIPSARVKLTAILDRLDLL